MELESLISPAVRQTLDNALSGKRPTREQLLELLALPSHSIAADYVRLTGRAVSQHRFGDAAMLLAQTGVESFPCPADCSFCSFARSQYDAVPWRISTEQLLAINQLLAKEEHLFAHFLLFMHTFDFESLLRMVAETRAELPEHVQVIVNCGDMDRAQVAEVRSAGASGFYHVLRLGEGRDTALTPQERKNSIECMLAEGLDWYTCCEPIGPEHTNEEIVDQILFAAERECFQNAVMRRIAVPGTTLASRGQIDLLRSAQIVAVVALAMLENPHLSSIAIHEPDLLGLTSGANCVYAEFGSNPRDTVADTRSGRAFSPDACREMLWDAGYRRFMRGR